jgi:short-subunit dehydrogenase
MIRPETALITGGTTGIGRELALQLARAGTKVVVCGRRQEMIDEVVRAVPDKIVGISADVSDPDRAAAVVAEAIQKLGSLDLVIANAGFGINKHASKLQPSEVVQVLALDAIGACVTITAAIPHMLSRGRGHLVGISSIAGMRGMPTSAAYSASKAALSTFLESIRVDLRSTDIKVTDVRPGFVDTPLTKKNKFPMPFMVSAEDAARRILRAIARDRRVFLFPAPLAIAAWLLARMPRWIYDRLAALLSPDRGATR